MIYYTNALDEYKKPIHVVYAIASRLEGKSCIYVSLPEHRNDRIVYSFSSAWRASLDEEHGFIELLNGNLSSDEIEIIERALCILLGFNWVNPNEE